MTAAAEWSGCYRLPEAVVLFLQDGKGWPLDLNRGRFYALDDIGTCLLTLTLERGPAEAVRFVAGEYQADEQQVGADCTRLLKTLCQQRLLVCQRPRTCQPRPPGRLALSFLLTLAWICVRLLRWTHTVRLWRGKCSSVRGQVSWERYAGPVQELDRAIGEAAAGHLLNPQCKERALVAWALLRRSFSLPAELVVGLAPYPFRMHAWVELDSRFVTSTAQQCEEYTPIARAR